VSADSDGSLRVEPAFSLGVSSLIVENLTVAAKHAVRNELFERRVLFHFRSRPVTGVNRIQNDIQILFDIRAESLEVSGVMKNGGWNDQNLFDGGIHGGRPF
jgi:hypothetical protein